MFHSSEKKNTGKKKGTERNINRSSSILSVYTDRGNPCRTLMLINLHFNKGSQQCTMSLWSTWTPELCATLSFHFFILRNSQTKLNSVSSFYLSSISIYSITLVTSCLSTFWSFVIPSFPPLALSSSVHRSLLPPFVLLWASFILCLSFTLPSITPSVISSTELRLVSIHLYLWQ